MSLRLDEVSYGYGREPVLRAVSLELRPGETVALVGPNGAGKSTVIRLLTRLARPWQGSVSLDGEALERVSRRRLAQALAVVPQGGELPAGYLVEALVAMGRAPHLGLLSAEGAEDRERVAAAMRRTGISALRARPIEALSGGERQRVLLARALAQAPRYLLLDEPTNHLDLRYQVEALRFVRHEAARGLGVLVVLHDLNLAARVSDRLLLLDRGRLRAAGPPDEVLREELLREVYGADVRVRRAAGERLPVVLPEL